MKPDLIESTSLDINYAEVGCSETGNGGGAFINLLDKQWVRPVDYYYLFKIFSDLPSFYIFLWAKVVL